MKPDENDQQIRTRQRGQAIAMGLALAAFVILMFAITIAKIATRS
jgi:hypothetical protein